MVMVTALIVILGFCVNARQDMLEQHASRISITAFQIHVMVMVTAIVVILGFCVNAMRDTMDQHASLVN